MRRWFYSGVCVCGHSWDSHHLMLVCAQDAYDECIAMGQPAYVPAECEFYGCNEDGGYDREGNHHCSGFVDKDRPRAETQEIRNSQ